MEAVKDDDAPSGRKEDDKDGNTGNDKSGSYDLYSFWNTFDPNEISPEPPPDKQATNEPKQEITDTQTNYHSRNTVSQSFQNTPSNIGYNHFHGVTDQNELQKISSAIAASQLSSAVMRKSDSFQNGLQNHYIAHNVGSDMNVIRNSGAGAPSASTHQNYFQHHSRYYHSKFQNPQEKDHRIPSTPSALPVSMNDGAHGYRPTLHHNHLNKQMTHQMQQQSHQKQHSMMFSPERYMNSSPAFYRGAQPSTNHGLFNSGYHANRYPYPHINSQNQNVYYPHGSVTKSLDRQYLDNNRVSSHGYQLQSQTPRTHFPQSFPPSSVSTPQDYSTFHNLYHGNSHQHNLATANSQQIQQREQRPKSNAPQTVVQPVKTWENFNKTSASHHSITAASNNLINNSIIYKNSETRERLPVQGTHSHHGVYQQPSYPVSLAFQSDNNLNSSMSARIQKPWDYIPKCNIQRDKNLQPIYNAPAQPSHQSSHVTSIQPHVTQSEKPSHDFLTKCSSNPYNTNFNASFTPTNAESMSNSSRSNVQPNTDTRRPHESNSNKEMSPHLIQRERHNYPTNYSNMNDLIKITDQVLNNEIKFSNIERGEGHSNQNPHKSYQPTPPISNPGPKTKQSCDNRSTDRTCRTEFNDKGGTICYKCGAFVESSSTIADDVTTIAVCHKCNEVLYFNTSESSAKSEKSKTEKVAIDPNSIKNNTDNLTTRKHPLSITDKR